MSSELATLNLKESLDRKVCLIIGGYNNNDVYFDYEHYTNKDWALSVRQEIIDICIEQYMQVAQAPANVIPSSAELCCNMWEHNADVAHECSMLYYLVSDEYEDLRKLGLNYDDDRVLEALESIEGSLYESECSGYWGHSESVELDIYEKLGFSYIYDEESDSDVLCIANDCQNTLIDNLNPEVDLYLCGSGTTTSVLFVRTPKNMKCLGRG